MTSQQTAPSQGLSGFIRTAGVILGVSYPVLAISTGFRAFFQLFLERPVEAPIGSSLSLIATFCYLIATVGFAKRSKWAWKLSVGVLIFETALTLIVGGLSLYGPTNELIGRNVWRYFGADYGFFPLIQPLLGIAWLFHAETRRAYGLLTNDN